ncbi:MAG: ATP-grasp domain-containing protein [Armatimonadota bacterium]|nr:ATP-grasp domain-containing protein [Armatimonadota bacterium]
MARLFEFQAKALLREHGVLVPRGRLVGDVAGIVTAVRELGGPVVLKPQILEGGRARRGLIVVACTEHEAAERGGQLLSAGFWGQLPRRLLVEERVDAEQEWYVAAVTDCERKAPLLMVSPHGGVSVEEGLRREQGMRMTFSPSQPLRSYQVLDRLQAHYALPSRQAAGLARLCAAVASLYREVEARLVELNPLAWTGGGWVALDGRIALDDDALLRRQPLRRRLGLEVAEEVGGRLPTALELDAAQIDAEDHRGSVHFVQLDPGGTRAREHGLIPVAVQTVGTGAFLTVFDELVPLGYSPVNFCDTSGSPGEAKIYRATRLVLRQGAFDGFLFVSCVSSQDLLETARGMLRAFQEAYEASGGIPPFPAVFCFRGWRDQEATALLEAAGFRRAAHVRLLGREATERQAVWALDELMRARAERGSA